MRIGLDAHILGKGKGGVERVVHQMVSLLPGLMPESEFVVFVNPHHEPAFPPRTNVRYRRLPVSDPLVQRSFVLPWVARRERLDLLHVQRAAPPFVRAKLVVHTHDLLPLTAPADHPGLRDRLVRLLTPGSLRRADGVLTVSETVAEEIRRLYPFTAQKTAAVLNGIEADFFRPAMPGSARAAVHARLSLDGDYVLYLGGIMARKNLQVAIRGFASFLQARAAAGVTSPVKLVLAGMIRDQAYGARLQVLARELAPDAVRFAGFVSEDECLALLQHARVFLAPSRGEGFDLPALEAMACAIPVICSELPVHRELLGDDALYFATDDAESLASRLSELQGNPQLHDRFVRAGPLRAARYTWTDAMRRLAGFYRQLQSGKNT